MKKRQKESSHYLKLVEWSQEDQVYIGRCPGLFTGGCHGDDETAVYAELCDIVDEIIADMKEGKEKLPAATSGKSYSGKFLLRVSEEMHQRLAIAALQSNESLNKFCVNALKDAVTH